MKTLISALALLSAGVAIGVLIAPDRGEKTRAKISGKFNDVKDGWSNFKGASLEELEELRQTFKYEIAGLKEDVRQRVLEMIKSVKAAKNNIRQEAMS